MKIDFNSLFWKVFGVNHRVYEPLDIFKTKRDKRADEEAYYNFINSDSLLSNEKYLQLLTNETAILDIFFIDYLLGSSQLTEFYIHQLNNIADNYKLFNDSNIEDEKYINMFSFQIAFIIENMNSYNLDISLFQQSLEDNSIMPFINRCKIQTNAKTNKELSIAFAYKHDEMCSSYTKHDIHIEEISPTTFEKDLSKWKKGKELPAFIKLITIINTIEKGHSPEKIGIFIQLLIIRALIHIQKEFKINNTIKTKFVKQINYFRKIINKLYLTSNYDEIIKKQEKYLINFPSYPTLNQNKENLNDLLKLFYSQIKEFFEFHYPNETVNIILPNRKILISKFNNCKTKDDYLDLLNIIHDVSQNVLYYQNINGANNFVRFVIAVKMEDQILFNEKFKYLDRSFGTLLSLGGIEKNINIFIEILKGKNDLIECINLITEQLKKLSTLE